MIAKFARILKEEFAYFRPRVWMLNGTQRLLPYGIGGRLRGVIYRAFGIPVGRGTVLYGMMDFGCYGAVFRNLRIGKGCLFNGHLFVDTTAPVTIGDQVTLGHHVMIITSNHDMGSPDLRAGAVRPGAVIIENSAWIAARVTILPGVTIGTGAVVAAGAVVTKDVSPHTLVGGSPARVIRALT